MGIIEGGNVIESLRYSGFLLSPKARAFVVDPDISTYTIEDALSECTDEQGDVLVLLPGSHAQTTKVNFNKQGLTVLAPDLGYPREERGEFCTIYAAAALDDDYPAVVTKAMRFIGVGFAGRDLTKGNLLVDCETQGGIHGGFVEFVNCRFPCWYGAVAHGLRLLGGAVNKLKACSFDGLFGGYGTACISLANDDPITPAYVEVLDTIFNEVGSGKHAIVHEVGSTPLGVYYARNIVKPGFGGNQGKFLDNNSVVSTGIIAQNIVAGMTNKAGAFENLTNSLIKFADNHYDET